MNKLVSVIVPVYNVENYLTKCITSIRNQTYQNIEIIIVNDGSTDDSLKICKTQRKMDGRIKLINQKNAGLSKARNTGIDNANGDYVLFVDSDDYIHPRLIEELIRPFYIDKDIDLTICNYSSNHISDRGNPVELWNQKEFWQNYYGKRYTACVVAWSKLYKKQLFTNGVCFDEGTLHEDEYILPKIIDQCDLIAFVNKPLYFYSVRLGSITHSESKKSYVDKLNAFILRIKYFNFKNSSLFTGKAISSVLFTLWKINKAGYKKEYYRYRTLMKKILGNINKNNIDILTRVKIGIFNFNDKLYFKLLDMKKF